MNVRFTTIESWASRFGYVVERTQEGYVWHLENELPSRFVPTVGEVMDAILAALKEEYGGER